MDQEKSPKLRNVDKVKPPYSLGKFPKDFIFNVGKRLIYHKAVNGSSDIKGEAWEKIFAESIGAKWKPSNVGLDDVTLGNCAWGAKTIKNSDPWLLKQARLISGRNSPAYSYDNINIGQTEPQELGSQVLKIWNARVESIREKYSHTRTVVLVKSNDLTRFTIFEFETKLFPTDMYFWKWNKRKNLDGYSHDQKHCFTWQPHGSQFTMIENVALEKICFKITDPPKLNFSDTLEFIGYDESWIEIIDGQIQS